MTLPFVSVPGGIAIFLDVHMNPVEEKDAVLVKILYYDGRIVFGRVG